MDISKIQPQVSDQLITRFAIKSSFLSESEESHQYTAELLAQLYDCVMQYGIEHQGSYTIQLYSPLEMHVLVHKRNEQIDIVITRQRSRAHDPGITIRYASGMIISHGAADPEEVVAFICTVDAYMNKRDLYDHTTYSRQRCHPDDHPINRCVDDVFVERTDIVCGFDPISLDDLRSRFDHPELLIVHSLRQVPFLCRKADVPYISRFYKLTDQARVEMGLIAQPKGTPICIPLESQRRLHERVLALLADAFCND